MTRLFRSGWDQIVHKSIVKQTQLKAFELKAQTIEYERATNQGQRGDMLRAASEELEARGFPRYEKHHWYEILAQNIYDNLNQKWRNYVFGHTEKEENLYGVVRGALRKENYKVYLTFNRTRERWPDLYAAKPGTLHGVNAVSVDGKVSFNEFKRYLEQCTAFARYSNKVFVAATPGLVAQVGMHRTESIAHGEKEFRQMLEDVGSGAYIVDMTFRDTMSKIDAPDSEALDRQERDQRLRILGYY
jgi:hypothetical protein